MEEKRYSQTIAQAINNYLTEDEWHFSFDENLGLFKFGLSLKGKIKKINYLIDVKEDEYVVYASSPLGAEEDDKEMMASMAEFVCRANYGLVNGNFELDMRDGEIRFKCFVDCEGITPTSEMVCNSKKSTRPRRILCNFSHWWQNSTILHKIFRSLEHIPHPIPSPSHPPIPSPLPCRYV